MNRAPASRWPPQMSMLSPVHTAVWEVRNGTWGSGRAIPTESSPRCAGGRTGVGGSDERVQAEAARARTTTGTRRVCLTESMQKGFRSLLRRSIGQHSHTTERAGQLALRGEKAPGSRHTLQLMLSPVFE
jgi:hypothetical protein